MQWVIVSQYCYKTACCGGGSTILLLITHGSGVEEQHRRILQEMGIGCHSFSHVGKLVLKNAMTLRKL